MNADRDTTEGYLESATFFRRLVELGAADALDHLNLAKALVFTEHFAASDAELKEARRRFGEGKDPVDVDYVAGLSKKRQQQYDEAARLFARVTERRPDQVYAWFQRGYMQELSNRLEEAAKSLRKALELRPRHRAAAYRLAMVLRRLERGAEAESALKIYSSIPKSESGDNEKCELTAVTLRPFDRSSSEPPEVAFNWTEVSDEMIGEELVKDVSRVRRLPCDGASGRDLLLIGLADVRILRVKPTGGAAVLETFARDIAGKLDAVVADFDNDKAYEVLVVATSGLRLFRGSVGSGFRPDELTPFRQPEMTHASGGEVMDAAAYDADHDGDLDVIVLSNTNGSLSARLLVNNGDRSFTRQPAFEALEGSAPSGAMFHAHDVDQANDLDFVFAGGASGVQAFLNLRDGTFKRVTVDGLGRRAQVLVEDLTGDGAPDFFATGGEPGWAYAHNADRLGRPYELRVEKPVVVSSPRCGEVNDACLADIDNDGDLDVLLATASGVVVLRNHAGGTFREEDAVRTGNTGAARSVESEDLDGDGLLEVLACTEESRLVVLSSGAQPRYASWVVRPTGGKDNYDAVGTIVEQYAGRLYQSRMIRDGSGLHLGLGTTEVGQIDGVRLRWPQGIIQALPPSALKQADCGEARLRQKEGLVASCPFLYAWGEDGWRFLTDIVGIAPLDEWLPPGTRPHFDPEEFVRIEGDALARRDGLLELAITEELRETTYLDRLELIVVDHHRRSEVLVDESTRQSKYGPLEVVVVTQSAMSPPASVELPGGIDGRQAVLHRDGQYAHGYAEAPSQWGGWVERYDLELTTAAPARALLLTGRIAWYDSTVAYSLAQHGRTWGPLRLEHVHDSHGHTGGTRVLIEDLGLPAGMDRTMVAVFSEDFSREPLPAGSHLRLSGHHRFLWDQLTFASNVERLTLSGHEGTRQLESGRELVVRTQPVKHATLAFHGYSKVSGDRARHEQTYAYEDAAPDDAFPPALGRATRYGDVTSLLRSHDDLLVVLVAGDGLEIRFDAPSPPPVDFRRTYFLRVTGWAKEGSFHNRTGGSIEPLPFRGMDGYPPVSADRRDDEEYRSYRESYQRRDIRRRAP